MSYFTRPLLTILLLGFLSGLPLALTGGTLAAWLFEAKVDKTSIGLFAAVATPYTLKFLWSPIMDSLPAPLLGRYFGRRRSWILLTQVLLAVSLVVLAFANPELNAFYTACAAMLVAFASASQDIVIDAYRVELLKPEEQGQGAAMIQLGYRLGMLASGAGALFMAGRIGWQGTYFVMACIAASGVLITLLAKEPEVSQTINVSRKRTVAEWLKDSVIEPFADFTRRESWLLILVFIVIYKLADAFIGIMTNPFYLDIGFTKDDIATIVKVYGTIATLIGTFMGGALVVKYGAIRILFVAGFLHALTNLLYVVQAYVGVDTVVLAASVTMENLTGGISAAAFVAYLSSLCNVHYTATQYALLSSLAALGRTGLSTPAGFAAQKLGWEWFFILSALLAIPGLLVLWMLNRRLNAAPANLHTP
jgi:MFS transporter, PAT family, beta-lactamase induction signal transducer AmpG